MQERIAFIISTLAVGGAEGVVAKLSQRLNMDYDIDIVLNDTTNIGFDYGGNLIDLGFDRPTNLLNYRYQLGVLIRRIIYLWKSKREGKYQVYISFKEGAILANLISGKKSGKIILSIRGSIDEHKDKRIYRYLIRPLLILLYKRADYIVAVSDKLKKEIIEVFKVKEENVIVIPNGYDRKKIERLSLEELSAEEKKWISEKFVVATMGRLVNEKGQWHLIRAFAEFHKQNLNTRLLILGEGYLKDYLKELISELGLEDSVILCGAKKNPFRILKHADLFVFPSLTEGFPNALAEAMCCKLPCIAADFQSGARELMIGNHDSSKSIKGICLEKYGVLVPVCDGIKYRAEQPLTKEEEILTESMLNFYKDEKLLNRYQEVSAERIVDLDMENIIEKWKSLF